MKNRFFVINKEKIYAYVVSIMTVIVIFFMTSMMNSDLKETEEVSSNEVTNTEREVLSNDITKENTSSRELTNTTENKEVSSNDVQKSEVSEQEQLNNTQETSIGEAISTSVSNMHETDNSNVSE